MNEGISILGSNHQSTKLQNRALVLKMICTGTNVTRIDISKQTGLSKMSITNIVNDLINEGFVTESSDQIEMSKGASTGRRPIFLEPDLTSHMAIGLYISRDHAFATLSNLRCEVLDEKKCSFSYEESEDTFFEKLKTLINSIISTDIASGKNILGIGIATIGPLDIKNGIILEPHNFHNLKSIPLKEMLEQEFGYQVYMDNDMNASALAEKLYGKAKDIQNFIYVGVTNGIGAGIITNGALFQGDMGFSGEIGHATINFEGPKCACGNTGCLELYASIPEIVSQARNSVALGIESALSNCNPIEWEDIVDCANSNDKLALNLIDRLCLYISIGLVSVSNIFDPQVIYLGHEIALADKLIVQKLEAILNTKIMSSKYKKIPVEVSAFSDKAPIAGSSAIVFDKLFNST